MPNGETPDGTPWWVKFVTLVGVPSAIACYLVFRLADSYFGEIQQLNEAFFSQNNSVNALVVKVQEEHVFHKMESELLRRILMANCINASTDAIERGRCLGTEPNR